MIICLQGCFKSPAVFRAIAILVIVCLQGGNIVAQTQLTVNPERKIAKIASVTPVKSPGTSITTFDTEQGLALSGVFTGLKDSKGNLWFGTLGGGASRYDGRSFQTYNSSHGLAHNIVMSILEDRNGDLWFGTFGGGVSRFDGISFTTLSLDDGLANNMVVCAFEDSKGNIWFGTFDGGVSRYNGKKIETFTRSQGLANDSVWSIAEDHNGHFYFATDNGVSVYDGKTFSPMPQMKEKSVRSLMIDSQRNIWFGTIGEGVFKVSPTGTTHYTKSDGLPDNSIWRISQDRLGHMWYGIYLIAFASTIVAFFRTRERKLKKEKLVLEDQVGHRIREVVLQTKEAEAQRQEAQKQKLEAERQRLLVEEKNEQIVKQLSHAEASLSNLTLQMIQRFHSFNELELELKKLAAESEPHSYKHAFSLISTTRSLEKEWEQFDRYFNRVHKNFSTRLHENQQLSPYEKRMCALIKMGFENREIAMLLNIETASVKMAKYRLKKKFQIDEKVDLQTYFESL